MNRSDLPTSGFHFLARSEFAPSFLPNDLSFGRIHGFWKGYFPASSKLTIIQRLQAGYSFGGEQPLHYRYYAGGYQSFAGYLKDALSGNNLLVASTAAQYRLYGNLYLTPAFHVGSTYDRIGHSFFETLPKWGWAAAVSWITVLGPVEAALAGSRDNILLLEFQIGRNF